MVDQHFVQKNRQIILHLILLVTMIGWTLLSVNAQTPRPSSVQQQTSTVTIAGQSLFTIQDSVGSFSAVERAHTISRRLEQLAQDPLFVVDALQIKDQTGETNLVADGRIIVTITDRDAESSGQPRQRLAREYTQTIKRAIETYRTTFGSRKLMFRGAYALIATLTLLTLLFLLNRLLPKLYDKLKSWQGTRIRSIRIQQLDLLSADRITSLLIGLIKILRQPVVLGLLYLYLLLVFSLFPWTAGIGSTLQDYLWAALRLLWQGFVSHLPNLVMVIVIGLIAYSLTRLLKLILRALEQGIIGFPGFYPEWARPTYQIARFFVVTCAIAIAVPYLPGSGSPALQGISIFLGIFAALGATAVIANVFAGLALTYTRAFKIGDRVTIAHTTGDVVERTFLVTRVCTPKNVVVTIPNSMVLTNHIINYSAAEESTGLILHTTVTLGYDVPWQTVHTVLIAAAQSTHHILANPAPFVLQTSLDDFYVSYELNAYTDQPKQMTNIYSELHQNIQDHCHAANLEILSPHYAAVRDGNHTAIPNDYLPTGYTAPGFRVQPPELLARPISHRSHAPHGDADDHPVAPDPMHPQQED